MIKRIFLCITFCLPLVALAENTPIDGESASSANTQPVNNNINDSAKSVEVGAGGNIKQERKYRTKIESLFEWHVHTLWESRYTTEGRDNLSGKSLISASSEFIVDDLSIVPWIADSPGADYSEFNFNIIYGTRLTEDLQLFAGYNHIRARDNAISGHDNEISLDLAYKLIKKYQLLATIYHSFESDGSFMELTVKREHRVSKSMHLSARGILGANAEYVTDGHNGINHFQLRTNVAYHPYAEMELYAYAGYNLAINKDATRYTGDEALSDFFWGGIGFTYRF